MYNITIEIVFLDYWHCGSGQSGGNESDALVVRYDSGAKKGLPYVPAKTLKGLIREMAEANSDIECKDLQSWFGNTADKEHKCYEKDEVGGDEVETYIGNADIVDGIDEKNIPHLFKTFKNTKLENGIAVDGTLREIETVVPLTLKANFINIDANETQITYLINTIQSIKRIGLGRNRGMGRCEVTATKEEGSS